MSLIDSEHVDLGFKHNVTRVKLIRVYFDNEIEILIRRRNCYFLPLLFNRRLCLPEANSRCLAGLP